MTLIAAHSTHKTTPNNQVLEAYFEGTLPDNDTLKRLIRKGTIAQSFVPMVCGSAFKNKGVQPLLDCVVDYLPSPLDIPDVAGVSVSSAVVVVAVVVVVSSGGIAAVEESVWRLVWVGLLLRCCAFCCAFFSVCHVSRAVSLLNASSSAASAVTHTFTPITPPNPTTPHHTNR